MKNLKDKIFLITGGTGSFGRTMLNHLLKSKVKEIRIFSRDELKQFQMRQSYNDRRIKYCLGDIRDPNSCDRYTRDVDFIFHAAALKQVPSSEEFPEQAVMTNILGSKNIIDSAINNQVKKIIMLSTDKAVSPLNAMGMTKALMEKYAISRANDSKTKINIVRYGNVLFSRGSVFPIFLDKAINDQIIPVTDLNMTRFLLSLDDAISLVLFALSENSTGQIYVKKAKSATVASMIAAIEEIVNKKIKYDVLGIRPGEKFHEILLSSYEMFFSEDHGDYFSFDSNNIKDFVKTKGFSFDSSNEFSSGNSSKITHNSLVKILREWIKKGKYLL